MKQFGVFFAVGILLLTGCGSKKTVVCSETVKADDGEYKVEVIGNLKDGKISSVDAKFTFDSEDTAQEMCSMFALYSSFASSDEESDSNKFEYKCDGKIITITNYEQLVEDDETKVVGMTKDEFIKSIKDDASEDEEITCK